MVSLMSTLARASTLSFCSLLVTLVLFFTPFSTSEAISGQEFAQDTDLICHGADCYPRLFRATEEFQVVREDQHLPRGLHIRLDIWTGLKEARLDIPMESEVDAALAGLPVDHALVLVDPSPSVDQEVPEYFGPPRGAPSYDPVGRVKKPIEGSRAFSEVLDGFKQRAGLGLEGLDDAMEELADLAHDIYYGLKITEDHQAFEALFCLMTADHRSTHANATPQQSQNAAYILSGALRNNPAALQAVAGSWDRTLGLKCHSKGATIANLLYEGLAPHDRVDTQTAADSVKARIAVIDALIKDAGIRAHFLDNGGMRRLALLMARVGPTWYPAQRKAGKLALDNFLDQSMGAVQGQWPTRLQRDDKSCREVDISDEDKQEGCWMYHARRLTEVPWAPNDGDSGWSQELYDKLASGSPGLPGWL